MIAFFDIETNGLYFDVTKAHCMVIILDDNGVLTVKKYRPNEVQKGAQELLSVLHKGGYIVGHNIINYDIPVLEKLFPKDFEVPRNLRPQIIDTLVLSHLMFSDISDKDYGLVRANKLPAKLIGSHSLKAWGYRLGEFKGTYAEETEDAWADFNEDMLAYNEQDVVVTRALYNYFNTIKYPEAAIELEHEAQWLMAQQERNGFTFDVFKAQELEIKLRGRHADLKSILMQKLPPIPDKIFIPKRDNKRLGYKAGVPIQRYKELNPNSRQQIEWIITKHYGYTPDNDELFEDERLKIDDVTFAYIKEDEAAPEELREIAAILEEYLMISKRLGQLVDGKWGWMKCVKEDGRIHGSVNPCGAVTGRATHSSPNVAQVPSINSPYGKECSELFTVPAGWWQVGVDASGLELRCLANFMYPYDKGAYAHEILNGDIHTANQKAAGLPTRSMAKTFIYGFLYGAGDAKIGKIVGGDAKDGKRLKKEFLEKTPAIAQLRAAIENTLVAQRGYRGEIKKWKRKYLKGLDGRPLHVRSLHSALNLLLQSAGALICKKWIVLFEQNMIRAGYDHGKDFQFMVWVHDEEGIACRTREIAEDAVRIGQSSMREAQSYYGFRVQLDTEGKIGKNWAETH